jgi:hypothetical protein
MRFTLVLLCASLCLGGCSSLGAGSNEALRQIAAEDQKDRAAGPNGIDWSVVKGRDQKRRVEVLSLIQSGALRSAEDFHNAALVFQHGESASDIELAHSLAVIAVRIDPTNSDAKWLSAASWDRLLMRYEKPQWYGTQYVRSKTGKWVLYSTDETAVTDEQRKEMGVPSIAEAKAGAEDLNK